MKPTIIYCAGGNRRFYEISKAAGFGYGVRLPDTVYGPLYFADQNWKRPDRKKYMAALARHKPKMATVLDWEREDQLPEMLSWAEEAAQHVEQVLLIPKVPDGVKQLPRCINGKEVVLAYSVPTRYGGTPLPLWSFAGWPVHLLGGSPHRQMRYWSYLTNVADVVSADGNMINLMATRHCQFWMPGTARYASNRYWPTLREANDGENWPGKDAPYEAFQRSCVNVMEAWKELVG